MNYEDQKRVTDWLLDRIRTEYADDIAIVIHCNSLKAPGDEGTPFPELFVPATERGKEMALSFCIDGEKHDFFCQSWERLEKYVSLMDYDTMIFADSTLLYARNEEDKARYESMKKQLLENLNNPEHMRKVAQKDYKWALEVYQDCFLSESLSEVMLNAGYVCDLLVHSIAGLNQRYIPHSFNGQYSFLESCPVKPEGFAETYLEMLRAREVDTIRKGCEKLFRMMRGYFAEEKPQSQDAQGLAIWYEEISYDWRRVRTYAATGDWATTRGWATKLQYMIETASKRYGVPYFDIVTYFDAENMAPFIERANAVENEIIQIIKDGGAKINIYDTADEFFEAWEEGKVRT